LKADVYRPIKLAEIDRINRMHKITKFPENRSADVSSGRGSVEGSSEKTKTVKTVITVLASYDTGLEARCEWEYKAN
jgi:hypothetical protein